ncbi:unnamed protein product, partial [Symbiodinium sp. CCMP2592]
MASFRVDEGGQDGSMNFDEAGGQANGMKLQGPERRPLRSDRTTGEVTIGDLPVRHLDSSATKLEQFADAIMHHPLEVTVTMFDNLYKFCCENKDSNLPEPFNLKKEPSVPYSMQIIIQTAQPPPGGDTDGSYVHIFKHVYLHRNKVSASDCVQMCHGTPLRFDWGNHTRLALTGLNVMLDKMGGKQLRYWLIKPKFEKKVSIDQQAREEGYKFIREFGPKANNRNQFMEWTDEQINTTGSKIEGWSEGRVKEAHHNHMRGRQNAKTIEHWPFTLKSFTPWFLDNVLSKMLPSMRQHAITWIGRTRTGKSLGSKAVLFTQSKYEIDPADRADLVPSILTAKHLDFFKAEPLTRFKPGVFDDGMLQRMDASFLKAFLNPSEEDATVWARYSSAHFEQGAGRHACNNPYDRSVDEEAFANMNTTKCWHISHENFIKLITPSFSAVDEAEDLDAILARTHFIVLTDSGVYHRVAAAAKDYVSFIPCWDNEPKDLLVQSQHEIFKAYKLNPHAHELPPSYHEDSVWSQELRRLLNGESIPRGCTIYRPRGGLFALLAKVKKEKVIHAFRNLEESGPQAIDLDTPSPSPKKRPHVDAADASTSHSSKSARGDVPSSTAILNPDFPGFGDHTDNVNEDFPDVGHVPDELEMALEREMVLLHAPDALNVIKYGCGVQCSTEMKTNLSMLGMKSGDIFVSDKWK